MKCLQVSPALVISVIALFVALGGTSYAALKIPRNSVGSAQVINGSLQKVDLANATVTALKGNAGPQGPTGVQGPAGSNGSQGAPGAAGPAGGTGPAGLAGSTGPAGLVGATGPGGPAGATGPIGATGPAGTNATINGVPAGGDLTGAYPNPSIQDGTITTFKFANNATAPNASLFAGLPLPAFLLNATPAGGDLAGTYPNPAIKDGAITSVKFANNATAPNANLLQGLPSAAFLQNGTTTAGGDLTGIYPNPAIKDGAITTAKFANGATAPNANLLDGIDSSGFLGVNATAANSTKLNGSPSSDYGNATWTIIVNGNGTTQFAHPGMSVVRNSAGNYTVSWTGFPGLGLEYCTGVGGDGTVTSDFTNNGTGNFTITFGGTDTVFHCVVVGI